MADRSKGAGRSPARGRRDRRASEAPAEGPTAPPSAAELAAELDGLRSRGRIKAFARRVETEPALAAALLALARDRGHAEAAGWSPKKLVRVLRERQAPAQQRGNPIHRDPSFTCGHCGRFVAPGGRRVRDHCPSCLRSLHVDVVPGDRAAGCGGLLDPVRFTLEGRAGVVITHRCRRCGEERRQRAHPDDQLPPDLSPASLPAAGSLAGLGGGEHGDNALLERARTLPMRVMEWIQRHQLWAPGQRVLLAVSGGLDSTVMLDVLAELDGVGARLEVASVDHGLRPEAVGEVAQVGRAAARLGLPFHPLSLRLAPGPNLAARARDARRAALLGVGADRICTAHHEDDQAETVLQRLLCGAGAGGLRGMAPLDGPWCRPLLGEPRSVLAAHAELRGLRWVEDPSNAGSQRGRLRALLPALAEIHGGGTAAIARSARLLAREDALLTELAAAAHAAAARPGPALDRAVFSAQHPALRLRMLRRLCGAGAGGPVPRADQLEALATRPLTTGAVHGLPGGAVIRVERDQLVWAAAPADPAGS